MRQAGDAADASVYARKTVGLNKPLSDARGLSLHISKTDRHAHKHPRRSLCVRSSMILGESPMASKCSRGLMAAAGLAECAARLWGAAEERLANVGGSLAPSIR